jgi:hypothetical protein
MGYRKLGSWVPRGMQMTYLGLSVAIRVLLSSPLQLFVCSCASNNQLDKRNSNAYVELIVESVVWCC